MANKLAGSGARAHRVMPGDIWDLGGHVVPWIESGLGTCVLLHLILYYFLDLYFILYIYI